MHLKYEENSPYVNTLDIEERMGPAGSWGTTYLGAQKSYLTHSLEFYCWL